MLGSPSEVCHAQSGTGSGSVPVPEEHARARTEPGRKLKLKQERTVLDWRSVGALGWLCDARKHNNSSSNYP